MRAFIQSKKLGQVMLVAIAAMSLNTRSALATETEVTDIVVAAVTGIASSGTWDHRYGWMYHLSAGTDSFIVPFPMRVNGAAQSTHTLNVSVAGNGMPSVNHNANPICAQTIQLDPYGDSIWSSPTYCDGNYGNAYVTTTMNINNQGWAYAYEQVTVTGQAWVASVRSDTY